MNHVNLATAAHRFGKFWKRWRRGRLDKDDRFNRLLRELCITWTKAVENILSATAESLPKLAIEELENAIQVLNVDMWNQSTTEATSDLQGADKLGGFTNKFVTRMCGASSRVMQVIDLHKETTETLAQIVVDRQCQRCRPRPSSCG